MENGAFDEKVTRHGQKNHLGSFLRELPRSHLQPKNQCLLNRAVCVCSNTFTRWFWCKTPLRNAPLEPRMDWIWGNFPKYFFQGKFSERVNSKLYSQWTHLECHFSVIPIDQSCDGFNSSPPTRQRGPLIKSRETNKEIFLTGILSPLHSHASLDTRKIFCWSESRFHLFL